MSNDQGDTTADHGDIYSASSVSDIRTALAHLAEKESTITARLDALLATQKDLNRHLGRLDLARAHLGSQVIATRSISNSMLAPAATTAKRLTSTIHSLDREQGAVKATLNVVEQVAELRACVLGIHGSMGAPQDWETAATYLFRARQIPAEVIDGDFAAAIVPTAEVPDPPRQTLETAAESLCGLFLREFEKAAAKGDGAGVTRFFKLFPLIAREDVGLEAYGRYVCSGIAARARSNLNSSARSDPLFYANALTKLFEHIAEIVSAHQPLVERHYGPGSMTKVIERIQIEADAQGGLILDTWSEERRVGRKVMEVRSYPFNFLAQSFIQKPSMHAVATPRTGSPAPAGSGRASEDEGGVEMKDVDALLNETAVMLSRWSLYVRFLASKTSLPPLASSSDDQDTEKLVIPSFITHSTLASRTTTLLIDPFTTLSTFFFRRSVEKAFQLDEWPSDLHLSPNKPLSNTNTPYITSAVDDVMYIVNQVLQRTLSTSQRSVVGSVIPAVGRVLGGDFYGMVQRKMRDECFPKAAIQGALPPEGVIVQFLVLVNSLDVSTEYVRRIVRTCLGQTNTTALQDSFPFGNDAVFVERQLHHLEIGFAAKTCELINEAVEVMLRQVLRPRLRPVLIETFRDVDYLLDDDDASDDEDDRRGGDENAVAARFSRGWEVFTLPIKRIVTPSVYNLLLTATIASLSRTLEKRLWSLYGRVSALGAVRLERDIAGIVAAAVKGGRYELRDLFARCVQITLVMNMEEDEWEEVEKLKEAELERESGVKWVLDVEERRRARGVVRERV